MRRTLVIALPVIITLAGCHHSAPPEPDTKPRAEVRDPRGNIIERNVTNEAEPPPPDITEEIPPKPYPTALYIKGYWYQERPNHRWIWIHGYWR